MDSEKKGRIGERKIPVSHQKSRNALNEIQIERARFPGKAPSPVAQDFQGVYAKR